MLFDNSKDEILDHDDWTNEDMEGSSAGLLLPRNSSLSLGNELIEQELLDGWKNQRLPHALIFSGLKGIGKATFAFRLTRFLLKNGRGGAEEENAGLFADALPAKNPDTLAIPTNDPIFSKVSSGGHPDLLVIERPENEKGERVASLPVDQVRRIAPFLQKTASDNGWRIVLVDDADTMNRSSQNAILKILEEPPAHTLIILVTHRAGAMLPTIRSRCRTIGFPPLSKENFSELIRRENSETSDIEMDTLYSISEGSVGQGLRVLDEGGLEMVHSVMALMANGGDWNWPAIHALADSLSRSGKGQGLNAFKDIIIWIIDCFIKSCAKSQSLPKFLENGGLAELVGQHSLPEWINYSDNLRAHFQTVEQANLDKRQAVLGAFMVLSKKYPSA